MSHFDKGDAPSPACRCTAAGPAGDAPCCPEAAGKICCVKVLGSGCKSCHALYENAKKALSDMGIPVEVEYVTDLEQIMKYGVMSMPALVVNEKVVAMGRVYKSAELSTLLHSLAY